MRGMKNTRPRMGMATFTETVEGEVRVIQNSVRQSVGT